MPKRTIVAGILLLASCLAGVSLRAAAYPFPQNQAQPYTAYYPVYSNADVTSVYNAWLSAQVTSVGAGGFRRVRRHGDPTLQADSTVSEGIGYGMVIAVYMNDQALFDDLWRYYNLHVDGSGLMNWYISADGATVLGGGPASDADQDVAWALCMANYQWGSSATLGSAYLPLANSMITKIYNTYVDPASKAFGPWGGAGTGTLNVSYFDPSEYRVFAQLSGNSGWLAVVDTCYTALFNSLNATNGNASNGLVPAWSNLAGQPVVAYAGAPTHFQYDSCRTPFRIAKDWYFFGEPRAKQYLDKINSFYVPIGAGQITDGYNLVGTERPQYDTLGHGLTGQSAAFMSPAMTGAMDVASQSAFVQTAYDNIKTNTLLIGGPYYDQCWTVMGLLMASGNFLNYAPTPTPTPTPDACTMHLRVNAGGPAQSGFAADQAYTAGGWGYVPAYAGAVGTSGGPITGDPNAGLYLDERYDSSGTGELRYSFTLPNGPATVTLHWAETYFSTGGQRKMNVFIGATQVETNLDIFTAAGGKNVALTRSYSTTVSGGVLTLRFVTVAANATIHAIEVTAGNLCTPTVSPTRTPAYSATPTPTRTPSFSPSPSFTISPTATPSPSFSPTFTALPTPDACTYVQHVNAGGGAYTDGAGALWSADKAYSAGSYGYVSWAAGTAGTSAGPIAGTTDDALYMDERYGNPVGYRFDLANGPYFVRIKLAETYMSTAGNRQVTLQANGVTQLNADLFTWTGGQNVARDLTFTVMVAGGRLDLLATSSNNSGTLMAIEVLGLNGCTPTRTPSITPGVPSTTATPSPSPSATSTRTPSASQTASPSPSPTRSLTASPSQTPTASATCSPSPSPSPTVSPANTLSATATASPTSAATLTRSPTGTLSASSTASPFASATATLSPVVTLTLSPMISSTLTRSPTSIPASPTPTATPSRSPLSSATWTPSLSPTNSPSSTVTASPTLSHTGTPSSTLTRSVTPSASPSASPTPSASPSSTATMTVSQTGTVSPSVTTTATPVPTGSSATPTPTLSPSFSVSPTATPCATLTPSATFTVSSSPTSTATPSATLSASPTPSITATATPSWTATPSSSASLTLSATLSPTPTSSATATPALTATSSVTAGGPTVTATPSAAPLTQAPADVAPEIEDYAFVPNPWTGKGPLSLYLKLKGRADAVTWRLYSPAMVCVAKGKTGPKPADWSQERLGMDLGDPAAGLYYVTLSAEGGGQMKICATKKRLYVAKP